MGAIQLPYPHLGQQKVRQQARRFNWLAAGRRWRKTTLAMAIAVEAAVAGKRFLWGAPTYDQVRIGWDETKRAAGSAANFVQSRMEATFPTGGSITFRSLDDPDNARGHTADGIVVDEASEVRGDAWYAVLRPMLLDTGGDAWFLFTPKGRNWVWREHSAAGDDPESIAWQVPTLGCAIKDGRLIRTPHELENPEIAFAEIEKLYRQMPERYFRQEILAEFIEDTGGVFRGIQAAATAERQTEAQEGGDYLFGVDWGKHTDFTVIIVLDAATQQVVAMDRFNQIDYVLQTGRLKALCERFRPRSIIAESNSMGTPLIEQLQRDGLPIQPFLTTNASKAQAIDALALAFERGEIRILDEPVLINELQAYESTRLPSGLTRYSAPEGMHDDTVMALSMAWHGIANADWWIY